MAPLGQMNAVELALAAALAVAVIVALVVAYRARRLVRQVVALGARAETLAESAPDVHQPSGWLDEGAPPDIIVHHADPNPNSHVATGLYRIDRALERARVGVARAEASRIRMERALRTMPSGVVVVDDAGVIVFRNDVAAEFAAARHGDALVEMAVRELVADAVTEGHAGTRTLDLFGPPRRTMVISARPLLTEGRAVGALATIDDITEKRRLEAIRRDFVANISHELKTPVGALSLLAETLADEDDTQVSRRLAERMVTEATRLANTIEDLLVLTRIESEEAPEHEIVPVHAVVAEAATRIQPAAEQAGIFLDVPTSDEHVAVMGDRRQLVSALYNLLDNAVKYSDAGSAVTVSVTTDGRMIDVTVADRGIGIPSRDLERVFERFYRVDLARSRQTGGTGLGLSIVRHVVANHDGEVRVDSRLGEGSTFTLRLPLTATGPVKVSPSRTDGASGRPAEGSVGSRPSDGRTKDSERDAG